MAPGGVEEIIRNQTSLSNRKPDGVFLAKKNVENVTVKKHFGQMIFG
jgi:hypothetical protein